MNFLQFLKESSESFDILVQQPRNHKFLEFFVVTHTKDNVSSDSMPGFTNRINRALKSNEDYKKFYHILKKTDKNVRKENGNEIYGPYSSIDTLLAKL